MAKKKATKKAAKKATKKAAKKTTKKATKKASKKQFFWYCLSTLKPTLQNVGFFMPRLKSRFVSEVRTATMAGRKAFPRMEAPSFQPLTAEMTLIKIRSSNPPQPCRLELDWRDGHRLKERFRQKRMFPPEDPEDGCIEDLMNQK